MAGNEALHEIPLGGGHLLKLDRAQGVYRAAYYWPRRDRHGKPLEPGRVSAKNVTLPGVLQVVFGEASGQDGARDQDPATVEHYIRSTAWGRELS
jgi:hypothetical protein